MNEIAQVAAIPRAEFAGYANYVLCDVDEGLSLTRDRQRIGPFRQVLSEMSPR